MDIGVFNSNQKLTSFTIAEGLGDKRLVVLIDDLDRCLPEKTIEILEVIKLFLDVPRCVFVIGVAREMIEQGFAVRYKTNGRLKDRGKEYIEKIIQVPFTLPPIREKDMIRFIENLGISKEEKEYAEIVARGTECNPRRVKMFLNTLRIRQEIAERTGGEIKPEVSAKLFVIEYTFPDFYKDLVKYREPDFLCTLERLAKGEKDETLIKELESSETLQKYYRNEDLKNVLRDVPFFCGMNIDPYIYLSEKPPEEVLVFDETILNELLSGDSVKIGHAMSTIKNMPESEQQQYLNITLSKFEDEKVDVGKRMKAAIALGKIGDTRVIDPLIEALSDENEEIRMVASEALGKLGNAQAVEPLIEALQDEEEDVRKSVAEALGNIGDVKAVAPLIAALSDKNKKVRWGAALALGNIGDAKAVEALKEALSDENNDVRWGLANALGNIGDTRAVGALKEALSDENNEVREGRKRGPQKNRGGLGE